MPTARGYVRVSTEEQAVNGVSIDAQKEILQAYAVVKGFTDFKIYTDEGFSGKNLNRPDVQRLLEECRSGKVEAVIVWRLDRLSRSLRDTLETIEDIFMPAGVSLISVTENIDTSTPAGRLMLNILASFAQNEREAIAERVRMAKNSMAKDCKHLGGYVPFGYKVNQDGYYEIDEKTAPIVREIFRMYNARMGYTAILRYLHDQGVKSPQGNDFKKNSLNYILRNEKYTGTYIHNRLAPQSISGKRSSRPNPIESQIRIPGGMPAIIDQATWEKTCAIREENKKCGGAHKPRVEFLLTGLCYCAVCGARMVVDVGGKDRNGTTQRYYVCKKKCVPPARKEELENAVFAILHEILTHEQILAQACDLANQFAAAEIEDATEQLRTLEHQRIAAHKRLHAITDYIAASGAQAPATLLKEIQSLESSIRSLDMAILKARRPRLVYDFAALRGVLLGVQLAQQKPPEQVKPLLQAALRGVYVSAGSYDLALHGIDNVEMRRVELLSEGSFTGLSPSAVRDLTFPPPYARGQAEGISSFMNTSTLQSLGVLVPRVNDVRNRPRGQAGLASRR